MKTIKHPKLRVSIKHYKNSPTHGTCYRVGVFEFATLKVLNDDIKSGELHSYMKQQYVNKKPRVNKTVKLPSPKFKIGKWYLQNYTDAYTNIIRCNDGKGFQTIYLASTSHGSGKQGRENARLMAASPDLYEVAVSYINLCNTITQTQNVFKIQDVINLKKLAIAAVKKALVNKDKPPF